MIPASDRWRCVACHMMNVILSDSEGSGHCMERSLCNDADVSSLSQIVQHDNPLMSYDKALASELPK